MTIAGQTHPATGANRGPAARMGTTVYRRLAAIVLVSAALIGAGPQPARAADNVVDGVNGVACNNAGRVGNVSVSINFDNTSGDNGATIDYIVVKADLNIYRTSPFNVDIWGDGTGSYVKTYNASWIYQGVVGGHKTWRADPSGINNARQVRVHIYDANGIEACYISGLTPYNL
jgi:hypothetical protein